MLEPLALVAPSRNSMDICSELLVVDRQNLFQAVNRRLLCMKAVERMELRYEAMEEKKTF